MDKDDLIKQTTVFYKKTFDSSFNAMSIIQEQTEKMVKMSLEQAPWFPDEGKAVIAEWVNAFKKGRDDFKAKVDDSYQKVEEFFDTAEGEGAPKKTTRKKK